MAIVLIFNSATLAQLSKTALCANEVVSPTLPSDVANVFCHFHVNPTVIARADREQLAREPFYVKSSLIDAYLMLQSKFSDRVVDAEALNDCIAAGESFDDLVNAEQALAKPGLEADASFTDPIIDEDEDEEEVD